MKTSIVIPNYNGKKLLEKNLPKVIDMAKGAEIIVVDDASTDGSAEYIIKNFPKVTVVKSAKNKGFSSTVNKGVSVASGDIVFLLNTDAIPKEGFLSPLLSHFRKSDVFAVGCMDESIENGEKVLRGRGVGSFRRGFLIHKRGEVDKTDTLWVSGGSGAFRKSLWQELGGMDEIYNPFYWEDIDLSYRAQKAGYRVVFEPESKVTHFHKEGIIRRDYSLPKIKKIAYRNQFFFVWINITDTLYIFKHLAWFPIHIVSALLRQDRAFFAGLFSALLQLPQVTTKRFKLKKLWKVHDKEIIV